MCHTGSRRAGFGRVYATRCVAGVEVLCELGCVATRTDGAVRATPKRSKPAPCGAGFASWHKPNSVRFGTTEPWRSFIFAKLRRSRISGTRLLPERSQSATEGTGGPPLCSVLHHSGFFLRQALQPSRWALTPPFHPYPAPSVGSQGNRFNQAERYLFCDTIRQSRLTPSIARVFTRRVACWCSDFPLPGLGARQRSPAHAAYYTSKVFQPQDQGGRVSRFAFHVLRITFYVSRLRMPGTTTRNAKPENTKRIRAGRFAGPT